MCIDEGVNELYVGRKVVKVIEFTPPRERRARSKIGLCSGISMVQVSPTFYLTWIDLTKRKALFKANLVLVT